MQTIGERMKWVISNWLPERKRFSTLEKLSGIPAGHWKNFWHGKQRAHEHMIQAMAREWPEFALWLVTGVDDPDSGQETPQTKIPSEEERSVTGKFLSRKIKLDEAINSTTTLAVLKDVRMSKTRSAEEEKVLLEKYADDLLEMTRIAALHGIAFDLKDTLKTLGQVAETGIANDPELTALKKARKAQRDN